MYCEAIFWIGIIFKLLWEVFGFMVDLFNDVLSLGYVGVFVFSLILNLVPFLSPSNIVISGAVGSIFPLFNPLFVGFLVALGASIAKTVHFVVSFFAGKLLSSKRQAAIAKSKRKYHRWGMVAAFIAAVSPVPDDPIVIPLGLIRYSPIKFFAAYFSGKIIITTTGAYLGQTMRLSLEECIGQTATIVISIILTIIITLVLIKKEYFFKKLSKYEVFRRILDKI